MKDLGLRNLYFLDGCCQSLGWDGLEPITVVPKETLPGPTRWMSGNAVPVSPGDFMHHRPLPGASGYHEAMRLSTGQTGLFQSELNKVSREMHTQVGPTFKPLQQGHHSLDLR